MTRCYAWPLSVTAGSDLHLHVSTDCETFGLRLFRFGSVVEEAAPVTGTYRGRSLPLGRPDEAWGWPRYSIALDPGLADGVYVALPVPADDQGVPAAVSAGPELLVRTDACLFILRRRPPSARPGILFKLPTATYAAYNQLGGVSLYAGALWNRDWAAQGYVVSLQRPGNGGVGMRVMEGDAPDPYCRDSRRQTFAHWDAPFVAWLEARGYPAGYCTDFDLHEDPSLLDGVRLLLSAGHDEYWSQEMRRRVLEFVDRGGNVGFFAGDVACFEVEISGLGDRLFCRKMAGGSPEGGSQLIGALWHVNDVEDWLTMSSGVYGGGWWDGRRAIDGYQPVVADHWAFDGVEFPSGGITGGESTPVIGYETDGVPLVRASDPPRLSEERKGGGGGRVLLAVGRLSGGWVAGQDQANAAIMIRSAPSGGMVFSTGTTDWPLALSSDPAVGRITSNVIDRLSRRSLVIRGPVGAEEDYVADGGAVGAGQKVGWYTDGGQSAVAGLGAVEWVVQGGEVMPDAIGDYLVTCSSDADRWVTVTAAARDGDGVAYFGSRTLRVLPTEEYLRYRIVGALNAMAFPDEQGGALVDQHASQGTLADRVIPVRLGWVRRHARILDQLMTELEAIWNADGRMAEGALRDDEK
jgi:hypothetical protein